MTVRLSVPTFDVDGTLLLVGFWPPYYPARHALSLSLLSRSFLWFFKHTLPLNGSLGKAMTDDARPNADLPSAIVDGAVKGLKSHLCSCLSHSVHDVAVHEKLQVSSS